MPSCHPYVCHVSDTKYFSCNKIDFTPIIPLFYLKSTPDLVRRANVEEYSVIIRVDPKNSENGTERQTNL